MFPSIQYTRHRKTPILEDYNNLNTICEEDLCRSSFKNPTHQPQYFRLPCAFYEFQNPSTMPLRANMGPTQFLPFSENDPPVHAWEKKKLGTKERRNLSSPSPEGTWWKWRLAPFILNLTIRWRWVVDVMPCRFTPGEEPRNPLNWRWLGHRECPTLHLIAKPTRCINFTKLFLE